MAKEDEDKWTLENIRNKHHALAANPITQNDYVKELLKDSKNPESDEEFVDEGVSWTTPQSQEELDELTRLLEGH